MRNRQMGRGMMTPPQIQRRNTMLKFCRGALAGISLLVAASTASLATPSSIIFIPSTDVQAPDTNHLGLDSYFSYNNPNSGTVTDFGYTRGFKGRFELGVD